ncbi:MAG: cell wall hydrolase [Paludibacteraceae bacterium]|nr:cell wall hydrolase [Paludibacteraceae bacterium]
MNKNMNKTKEPLHAQTGSDSYTGGHSRETSSTAIISKTSRFVKRQWPTLTLLALILLIGIGLGYALHKPVEAESNAAADPAVFYTVAREGYKDGTPISWQHVTNEWALESGMEKRYELTDKERLTLAQVVEAEAAGEPYAGKVAVAQCILQSCEDDSIRPDVAVRKYGYSSERPTASQESLDAVQAVFDFGEVVTAEPIKYFYAPDKTKSKWHETQDYVLTINGHKFFKEAE